MSLSDRLLEAWYEGHPALIVLRPLEWVYRCIVIRKRKRFLRGEGAIYRAPVPVIVVGNITVGGTGKTPLIVWLADYCHRRGLRVGVLSRGYGANPSEHPHRVSPCDSAAEAGDEPLLIVQRTGVPMMIDPIRSRGAQALLEQEPLDLLLADDGLQHYRLARDLEFVLIDAARGLGNERCLPAGPLREPAERLAEVDAVLFNGASTDSAGGFGLTLQPTGLVNVASGERVTLAHFPAGQAVHAVAGIGNPERFFATLERLTWQPIRHPFADHATFDVEALSFEPSLPVIMTEKDAVKCRAFAQPHWWYLEIQAEPSEAFRVWFDSQLNRLLPGTL
ncbi:tetraacyldisaccharide 4'-kinase [Pseudomonas sp. Marseille-QA0892]